MNFSHAMRQNVTIAGYFVPQASVSSSNRAAPAAGLDAV